VDIDGKNYRFEEATPYKRDADSSARQWRRAGYLARVKKITRGRNKGSYGIYKRRKR